MNRERLVKIGKFLNDRLIIHINVEHDTPWTIEEKMIQELYDNYLDLLIEYGKQNRSYRNFYSIRCNNIIYNSFINNRA